MAHIPREYNSQQHVIQLNPNDVIASTYTAIVFVHRKLQEAELETLLKDPNSRANRVRRLGISS